MNLVLLRFFAGMMVLLSVVAGCGRKVVPSITTEVSDSVLVREVPRFIPVPIPGDTVEIERLVECDSVTNKPKPFAVTKKATRASLQVSIDTAGRLQSKAICDSLQKIVEAKDREIRRIRKEKTVIEKPVYVTTGFDRFCRWWFAITATILIVTIFLKLKNF